jgi:WD40 repeat protein
MGGTRVQQLVDAWPVSAVPSPMARRVMLGHTKNVIGAAVAPDGSWLATTSADQTVRIWDAATWQVRQVLTGHTDSLRGGVRRVGRRW